MQQMVPGAELNPDLCILLCSPGDLPCLPLSQCVIFSLPLLANPPAGAPRAQSDLMEVPESVQA